MKMPGIFDLNLAQKSEKADLPCIVLPIIQYLITKLSAFAHIEVRPLTHDCCSMCVCAQIV